MANETPDFSALLDAAPTEVNRPKPLPVGSYLCIVQGQPVYDKSSKKSTPFAQFTLKPIQALDDVDAEALAEMGGIENKTLRTTFYLTEDAVYRLDEFHQHCGIDLDTPASRGVRNENCVNAQVIAVVKHRPSDDGTTVFAEVSRTAPAA